jgi:hypothetical protein
MEPVTLISLGLQPGRFERQAFKAGKRSLGGRLTGALSAHERGRERMEPVTLTNSEEILQFLSRIALKGSGFTTECLLLEALDAGLSEPDYLNATGVDPDAFHDGTPHAWANYHVRQSKKVFAVYGGPHRRTHIADTP